VPSDAPSGPLTGRRWPSLILVLLQGLILTVAWHAVVFAAAFGLPPLSGDRWPDLRPTVINLTALLVPIAVVLWNGWWREPWFASLLPRRPVLLLPVLVLALLWGVQGLSGSVTTLASSALLLAVLGINEEVLSRGTVQRILNPLSPQIRAVSVGALFAFGHLLSGIVFSRPMGDTLLIVVSTYAFGYCYAALRMHVVSVWPLGLLHGLDDFMQINSPAPVPFGWHVANTGAFVVYGWWLLRRLPDPEIASGRRIRSA
jgi:hypothetical protein